MPTVSIIVPCYNGGEFLPALMRVIEAQTWRDFETIIVDDGSTDAATLAQLQELPAAVRVVRQENRGLPGARNTGFRLALGRYVLPLDCDDAISPDFLARAVPLLDQSPPDVGFVFCDMQLKGRRGGVLRRRFNCFDQLYLNQLPYALLMRREAWVKAGGYDETMRDGYEDWEFNLRLIKAGFVGRKLNAPLFTYFVRADGMLLSHSARNHGRIWRYIRDKHPELYAPEYIRRAYAAPANEESRVGWWLARGLMVAARTLSESGFGQLFRMLLIVKTRLSWVTKP
jgi:glycosyltransferase involved in cell wall biosynthesis